MYTQRHFESIAAILLNFRDEFAYTDEGAKAYGFLVRRFTDTFARSNGNFVKGHFHKTCGWTSYINRPLGSEVERGVT